MNTDHFSTNSFKRAMRGYKILELMADHERLKHVHRVGGVKRTEGDFLQTFHPFCDKRHPCSFHKTNARKQCKSNYLNSDLHSNINTMPKTLLVGDKDAAYNENFANVATDVDSFVQCKSIPNPGTYETRRALNSWFVIKEIDAMLGMVLLKRESKK